MSLIKASIAAFFLRAGSGSLGNLRQRRDLRILSLRELEGWKIGWVEGWCSGSAGGGMPRAERVAYGAEVFSFRFSVFGYSKAKSGWQNLPVLLRPPPTSCLQCLRGIA